MNKYARNILQRLFIKLLNMLMMCNMVISHHHLPTANNGTNVRHTVIVPNLLMLIVRIALCIE